MQDKVDINVCIVDYGMGNLRSVLRAVQQSVLSPFISSDPADIMRADKLILPGVGHFKQGMINLKESGLMSALQEKVVEQGTPILGICLGMQLFTSYSEEGNCKGLNWIEASTTKFDPSMSESPYFKTPHMGWNTLSAVNGSAVLDGMGSSEEFYFCHSYFVKCVHEANVLKSCRYGIDFHASIQNKNIQGVQFHPEKSHGQGASLIEGFLKIDAMVTV